VYQRYHASNHSSLFSFNTNAFYCEDFSVSVSFSAHPPTLFSSYWEAAKPPVFKDSLSGGVCPGIAYYAVIFLTLMSLYNILSSMARKMAVIKRFSRPSLPLHIRPDNLFLLATTLLAKRSRVIPCSWLFSGTRYELFARFPPVHLRPEAIPRTFLFDDVRFLLGKFLPF